MQVLGEYPEQLAEEHCPLNMGRGRFIPTTPWEGIWWGVAKWFGVPQADLPAMFPYAKNFPAERILTMEQLFKTPA